MKPPDRSLSRFVLLLLCTLSLLARAAPKKPVGPPEPGSKAALTAALTAAHKIYLREDADVTTTKDYSSQYVAFYEDMQTWGRYQLLPSTDGADLIFLFSPFCIDTCYISVYNGKTMEWVGDIQQYMGGSSLGLSKKGRIKGAAKFIKKLMSYAGTSPSAPASTTRQPVSPALLPLPDWANSLGSGSAPALNVSPNPSKTFMGTPAFQTAFLAWVKSAHRVLIVDDGLRMSKNSPFVGMQNGLSLLDADLDAWGRYQRVSSLSDADFVMIVEASRDCDKDIGGCEDSLYVSVRDPKTLRLLRIGSLTPKPWFKKGHPDLLAQGVANFVGTIRSMLGDPTP